MKAKNYFIWCCVGLVESEFPDIYCPKCNRILVYQTNSLTREETSKSTLDGKNYIFTCKYICEKCNEPAFMTGIGYSENQIMIYENPHYNGDTILYTPLFFNPTIPLFHIPTNCPEKVKTEIIKSFSLFWNDIYSCANKLRFSLELLLDEEAAIETITPVNDNQSKHKIALHHRIQSFKKRNQKVGELLEAIKWIGNKGSHADKKLIVNEVISAYEILEYALNELYEPPKKDSIYIMAQEINKRKG